MAIDSATSLLFAIGANTDDAEANISRFRSLFSSSLSDLKTQFSGFASDLTGGADGINVSFAAMSAVAAGATVAIGAGLFEMARKTAETGEQLLLLSQQIGVSVQELSGLKVIAEQMGVSFDTLSRGVAIMDRSLSPFASSGATAAKALASIGVSATDAHGKLRPNVDLLADIADKFQGMDDGANKTALAMSIFGRSGMEMIPILDRGGAAIRSSADEAQKLGLVFDQAAAEKSAKFEEATRTLTMTFEGLVQKIGLKVIPIFTAGLNSAIDGASKAFDTLDKYLPVIKADLGLAVDALIAYVTWSTLAALRTVTFGTVLLALEGPIAAVKWLLGGLSLEMAAATGGLVAVAAAIVDLIREYNDLVEAEDGAAKAWAGLAQKQHEAALASAKLSLAIQQVTGHMITGNTVQERTRANTLAYASATAEQKTRIDALVHSTRGQTQANEDAATSLSTLSSAYNSVTSAIESMQDQMAKPEAAARAQYERGLASAEKQIEAYRKQAAAGKKMDESLEQYEREYQELRGALAQKYLLTLQQDWAQEDQKEAQRAAAKEKQFEALMSRASASANAEAKRQADAWTKIVDGWMQSAAKFPETFAQQEKAVDETLSKLDAISDRSAQATMSAEEKIHVAYQRQLEDINKIVAAQMKLATNDQEAARIAVAAARAREAAATQETADLAKLRQQQLQTAATQINSFAQMGLAAAGYRSTIVDALMKVIATLEAEAIAHATSAAGAAAAENIKSAAVGKGVGIRSVWHAAEEFALGLADTASFNFAGAAQHFAASGAFASVAASVGTAVAGLFAGGGGGGGGSSAAASTAAAKTAGAASSGTSQQAQTTINVHIDGMLSEDNLATVMQKMTGLVGAGQAKLGSTHVLVGGALVATG